jgi:two-component system sensor histidine kinase RegB
MFSKLMDLDLRERSRWLIRIRWIVLLGFVFGYLAAKQYSMFADLQAELAYRAIFAVAVAANLFYYVWLAIGRSSSPIFIGIQIGLDNLVAGALIVLTGACMNPFYACLYVQAAIGALFLRGWVSLSHITLLSAIVAVVCFQTPHDWVAMAGVPHHSRVFVEVGVAWIIWVITSWVMHQSRQNHQRFLQLSDHKNKLDHLRFLGLASANITHELASPLNVIEVKIERLKRQIGEDSWQQDLQAMEESLSQCKSKMAEYFRNAMYADEAVMPELLDINRYLIECCEKWRGFHFECDLQILQESTQPNFVKIPRFAFMRSIFDLLDNAREAVEGKDPVIQVQILNSSDNKVKINFVDNGPGIPNQILSQIGTPFRSTKKMGSGLGLYNCQLLTNMCGGKLEIANSPRGARVTMIFPTAASPA